MIDPESGLDITLFGLLVSILGALGLILIFMFLDKFEMMGKDLHD